MIVEGTTFQKKVYINMGKIDYFYVNEKDVSTNVVIGETIFLIGLPIFKIRDMIDASCSRS